MSHIYLSVKLQHFPVTTSTLLLKHCCPDWPKTYTVYIVEIKSRFRQIITSETPDCVSHIQRSFTNYLFLNCKRIVHRASRSENKVAPWQNIKLIITTEDTARQLSVHTPLSFSYTPAFPWPLSLPLCLSEYNFLPMSALSVQRNLFSC